MAVKRAAPPHRVTSEKGTHDKGTHDKGTHDKGTHDKGTGGARVYEGLRRLIVSLEIAPGDGLDENQIVRRFSVSRTPAREALTRLAGEGLVILLPNRRAKVAPMNLRDIKDHLEALDLLQPAVCHWASVRRDDHDLAEIARHCAAFEAAAAGHDSDAMIESNFAFHAAIGTAARNASIDRAHRRILTDQLRISRMAMTDRYYGTEAAYTRHLNRIIREHREILQAIADRDPALSEQAGRRHAALGRVRISDYLAGTLADTIAVPSAEKPTSGKSHLRAVT